MLALSHLSRRWRQAVTGRSTPSPCSGSCRNRGSWPAASRYISAAIPRAARPASWACRRAWCGKCHNGHRNPGWRRPGPVERPLRHRGLLRAQPARHPGGRRRRDRGGGRKARRGGFGGRGAVIRRLDGGGGRPNRRRRRWRRGAGAWCLEIEIGRQNQRLIGSNLRLVGRILAIAEDVLERRLAAPGDIHKQAERSRHTQ